MRLKIYVSTNKVGSLCEDIIDIDKEDWEIMDDREKNEFVLEQLMSIMDWGWEELN
jgi:hypothetical protein